MTVFEKLLSGGDLRSLNKSNSVISKVKNQKDFDELLKCLFHINRLIVMRAADVIEKITINTPQYLAKHKNKILGMLHTAENIELKWHLALLIPRLDLNKQEFADAWIVLTNWAKDTSNSRIVRVNSIQALFEMTKQNNNMIKDFNTTANEVEIENISSLNARIKNIRKKIVWRKNKSFRISGINKKISDRLLLFKRGQSS